MPYDAQTRLYTSRSRPTPLPDRALTIFDFLFDLETPFSRDPEAFKRPDPRGRPWILDAHSPRAYTFEQTKERTLDLARAFATRGLKEHDTVLVVSPNDLDYGPCLWATFRTGAVVSCANPSYMADELVQHIRTGASLIRRVVVRFEGSGIDCFGSGSSQFPPLQADPCSPGRARNNRQGMREDWTVKQDDCAHPTAKCVALFHLHARCH